MDFDLPTSLVSSTTAVMSDMIDGLSGYITLILGVILAVVVIEVIIGALRK